jgi:hypothetical protein
MSRSLPQPSRRFEEHISVSRIVGQPAELHLNRLLRTTAAGENEHVAPTSRTHNSIPVAFALTGSFGCRTQRRRERAFVAHLFDNRA